MARNWGDFRDYFSDKDPLSEKGYWRDTQLDSIFDHASPATRYGFSDEFTTSDEREGRQLFYNGFVSQGISPTERQEARDGFLDWMDEFGMTDDDIHDFWDNWRDWYDSQ